MLEFPVRWKRKAFICSSFFLLISYMLILNITTMNYIYERSDHVPVDNVNATAIDDDNDDDPLFDSMFNGPVVNPCQVVNLQLEICQVYWVSQVIFSVLFVFWNLLVVVALLVTSRKVVSQL